MSIVSLQAQSSSEVLYSIELWYKDVDAEPASIIEKIDSVLSDSSNLSATELTYLYNVKSECYYYLGNIESSDSAIIKSIAVMPPTFSESKAAEIYNNHGQNLGELGRATEAKTALKTGLKYAKLADDSTFIGNIYYNLALHAKSIGHYHKSVTYLDSCLTIDLARQDSFGLSHTLRLIGAIQESFFDRQLARKSYREALRFVTNEDPSQRCAVLTALGSSYYMDAMLDSTSHYLQLSIKCFKQYTDRNIMSYLYKLRGSEALLRADSAEAVRSFLTARSLAEEVGDHDEYNTNSILAFDVDPTSISVEEIEALLQEGVNNNIIHYLAKGYAATAEYYAQRGNHKRAYSALALSQKYLQEQVQEESSRMVASQTNRYELSKKENTARLAEERLRTKQAQFTTYSLITLSLFAAIIGILTYRSKKAKLLLQNQKLAKETKLLKEIADVESQAFRAQMNPHFLFNALNSIKGLIVKKQDKEAAVYISKFSKLVRNVLDHSRSKTITVADELTTLEMYMKLEQMRYRDGYTYSINVVPQVDVENTLLPPVTLQPFVENAIWHGFKNNERDNHIDIDLDIVEENLVITITDNGIGRHHSKTSSTRQSHGINITRQRIYNFSNDHDPRRLQYTDPTDKYGHRLGTIVQLRLPIKQH